MSPVISSCQTHGDAGADAAAAGFVAAAFLCGGRFALRAGFFVAAFFVFVLVAMGSLPSRSAAGNRRAGLRLLSEFESYGVRRGFAGRRGERPRCDDAK